jgi:hypothetical protein
MKRPTVEVLYFEGCPHHEEAVRLVERVAADLGVELEVLSVEVPDSEAARRERFLGSPSIRVNGSDVDPDAGERTDYAHSCRVYRTTDGLSSQPDESWVSDALSATVSSLRRR